MFQAIKLLNQEVIGDKVRTIFEVKDTCFSQEALVVHDTRTGVSYCEPVALFNVYASRNLNIVRNLSIYYLTMEDGYQYLMEDKTVIDIQFPSLGYGKRYHALVKKYYRDLQLIVQAYDQQGLGKQS